MQAEAARLLDDIPFEFDRAEFDHEVRAEAYPELSGEVDRYLERALPIAQPVGIVRVAYVGERDGDRVEFGGQWFESATLGRNLEGINRVFAYVTTCGRPLYELDISDLDPFASVWHETLKLMAVRDAATWICEFVRSEFDVPKLSSMNPGSGDAHIWPIDQQHRLFAVLGEAACIGVELTESSLMIPYKSISGIFFPSERAYSNCESCTRKVCPDRRAPYRPAQ
jgi:hypothetical protein